MKRVTRLGARESIIPGRENNINKSKRKDYVYKELKENSRKHLQLRASTMVESSVHD